MDLVESKPGQIQPFRTFCAKALNRFADDLRWKHNPATSYGELNGNMLHVATPISLFPKGLATYGTSPMHTKPKTREVRAQINRLERDVNKLGVIPATGVYRSRVILALLSKALTVGKAICTFVEADVILANGARQLSISRCTMTVTMSLFRLHKCWVCDRLELSRQGHSVHSSEENHEKPGEVKNEKSSLMIQVIPAHEQGRDLRHSSLSSPPFENPS